MKPIISIMPCNNIDRLSVWIKIYFVRTYFFKIKLRPSDAYIVYMYPYINKPNMLKNNQYTNKPIRAIVISC